MDVNIFGTYFDIAVLSQPTSDSTADLLLYVVDIYQL